MLIKNGTIIDGTRRERYLGDIRIEKDIIKEIGKLKPRGGEKVIKAEQRIVAPGFVDIINRSDIHFSIFRNSGLNSVIKQGVTTILGGSCGASLAPLVGREAIRSIQKWSDISYMNINWASTDEFLREVARHNISVNFATLTGHATLRRGLVGDYFGKITEDQIKKMEYLLARSMEEGSFGLSAGLAYSHEKVVPTEELERLARVVSGKGGIYAVHLRDEGAGLVSSVKEIVEIAKKYNVSSHIFHFKALGKRAWSEFENAIDIVKTARDSGVLIDFDMYPYTRTASVLYLLLPEWATEGGKKKVLARLHDEKIRARIREELKDQADEIQETVIGMGNIEASFIGKTIGEIAKNQETSAIDILLNIIIASEDRIMGFLPISEKNVEIGMRSGAGFIASDGVGYSMRDRKNISLVHPRSFGTFPRFLGRYIRERNMMSWEDAIHRITLMPAQKIGLKKRGKIEKGYFADIVIFNPQNIRDIATFDNPFQYSEGLDYVIVNGGLAVRRGKFQKRKYGKVLRK
ncbi:MAG: amidohydrolase family protein [Candidatus Spechtbacterales bacterium]